MFSPSLSWCSYRHWLAVSASVSHLWLTLALTAAKIAALVAFIFVVGNRVIPRLLDRVAATRSRELFTLTVLFSGEGEVALALTEAVLRQLGATPEQIERQRARAHEELFDLE
jgi:predicted Kef-type K+ transport protein